jgi:hypothetical protein
MNGMKLMLTFGRSLLFAAWMRAQASQKPKPAAAAVKQEAAKKYSPTLGFNHIKDVSPIADEDAFMEELKVKKELPDNPLVNEKRAIHCSSIN